jgi:hypothetical protein
MEPKLDDDVFNAYKKCIQSGAMSAVLDRKTFENYFASEGAKDKAIERKILAYEQVFLPEYLKLMQAEVEKRKLQKQQEKQENQGQGDSQPKEGSSQPNQTPDAVPLTKEEEQEIIERILKQLEEAGKEFQALAPSEEEQGKVENILKLIQAKLVNQGAKPKPLPRPEPQGPSGEEVIRELSEELQRNQKDKSQRGLAESLGTNRKR